ncbi:hypothetical protein [Dictyobacter formicarum]|uniref:Uncharacterized protein n=1 Tax=Dictyobacter formicarum TaxID=2778368 RepID=A0ABQ3VJY8_9CHLR|nr:hypothetical protein [Dictyobacter formicarum]GHO86492.1 hypothetical protein KSZ_44980 [Dictyobacter formicarum]
MPRLKKVLLVKAVASDELFPHTPITANLLPSLALSPVTDELGSQSIHPLFGSLPITEKNIFYPQLERANKTLAQTRPQRALPSAAQPAPTIKKVFFARKPIVIAGNTLLLSVLSYLLFRHQRAYLFLSWYLLLLLWSYLTFKPVRQLFAQGIQGLRLLWNPPTQPAIPASKTYRDEHMRQLQGDTGAYLQALRDLHKKSQS